MHSRHGYPDPPALPASHTPLRCGKTQSALLGRGGLGREAQADAVDAVAQAGRLGTVGEHVAQVAAAAVAEDLGARREEAAVHLLGDATRLDGLVEAGPARAGLELRPRAEERRRTCGAD